MLDAYYSNSRTIWRFRNCGMLGDYMDGFADYLEGKQFSRSTAREYLRAARHLSMFAFSTGATEIGELSTELIDAFVNDHLPVCTCERMNGGKFEGTVAAMSYLVEFLSAQGAVNVVRRQFPAPPLPLHVDRSRDSGARPSVEEIPLHRKPAQERRQAAIAALPSQTGQALIRYDEYLKRLFGLTDKTREIHRSKMLFFIQWLVQTRGSGFGLSELTTTEIIEFQNVCNGDGFSYDYRPAI